MNSFNGVQAIAYYRQRKYEDSIKYLNNFLACTRMGDGSQATTKWGAQEELLDVFGIYCSKTEQENLKDEMARALSLSVDAASAVKSAVAAGTFGKAAAAAVSATSSSSNDSIF